jgi:hypothetical protein
LVFHPKFVVQAPLNYPVNRPRIKASCTKSVSKFKRGGMPSKPYVATRLKAYAVVAAHALAPQNVAGRGQLHAWSHFTGHDPKAVAPLSFGTRLHSEYWLLRGRCWSAAQHPSAFAAALIVRRRYFIVAPRPFASAPLVVSRRCLIVVPMPMPEEPRMSLIVVHRPLPAAPLVVRCIYMFVVPGPMPTAAASR